ncbi:MAG: STAS-like domain-containing protein [Azoarcus sp.]|jgi:hypothetical protein|nr:STAS-like domain-containing protein [Azoarcus sp.]
MTKTINVAREFSRYPAGRYAKDGPYTGEIFRDKHLIPALGDATAERVVIEFDGTRGLASSFLEEAFGGLVRRNGFTLGDLKERLELKSSDESIIHEVWEYIGEATASIR